MRDDPSLVKGCGQHALASLRLPPPERAAEIFAHAGSQRERVRRLVDTLFDVYERGVTLSSARAASEPRSPWLTTA
ncbi:MAG: hypothetical protein AABM66_14450 [Actinomycetota bacterium]